MKKLLLPALLLFFVPVFAFALSPSKSASLYEHLKDVNAQWQHIEPTAQQLLPVSFENDTRRIQAHLFNAEQYLRSQSTEGLNKELLAKRLHLLDVLHSYAEAGVFPQNYDFNYRIPYFIDAHNTACAVGYLIIADGHKALAEKIQHTNNYQYLLDMQYPELTAWVTNSSFTAQELALIQPGYLASTPFSYLNGNDGGTNGHVNDVLVANGGTEIYVAGSFSSVGGSSAGNIAVLENGTWTDLDGGVDGEVFAMAIFNNELYVGGAFDSSFSGVYSEGVIKWTGTQWEVANTIGLYGEIYAFQVYNGKLYLGGDFELPTGALRGYLSVIDSTGAGLYLHDFPMGPVNALTIDNNKLIVGGNFSASFNSVPLNNIAAFDDTSITSIGNGINANVKALAVYNNQLYTGGSFFNNAQDTLFGFGYWADTAWVNESYMVRGFGPWNYDIAINDFVVHNDNLFVAGDFACCDGMIAYYGYGIGSYFNNGTYSSMMGVTSFNDAVNTISVYNGELLAGGVFDTVMFSGGPTGSYTVGNLGGIALKNDNWNSINEQADGAASVKVYPVPASGSVTFQMDAKVALSRPTLTVYNALGQQVSSTIITQAQTPIDVNQWLTGVYMYQLQGEGAKPSMGRFVVE